MRGPTLPERPEDPENASPARQPGLQCVNKEKLEHDRPTGGPTRDPPRSHQSSARAGTAWPAGYAWAGRVTRAPDNFPVPSESGGLVMRKWDVEQLQLEFTDFYTANRDNCLRIVLLNAGDRQLAEDLVAEAFARAWASWRKVRVHPAPIAWVVRTALNTNVSWRRRLAGPGAPVLRRRLGRAVGLPGLDHGLVAAVAALPARQREVLVLRVLRPGHGDDRLAARDSPGTVGSHLHKALTALRTRMPSFSGMGE